MRARFVLGLLAILALPLPGHAQAWFTREACTVTNPQIDPEVLGPAELAGIQQEAATIENGVGRLWRITSPAGAVSHLWGTMHSNDPLLLDLPDALLATIERADVVALEHDITFPSRDAILDYASGAGFYADQPHTLTTDLNLEVVQWITARLTSLGLPGEALSWIRPSRLVELLLADPCNDFTDRAYPIQDDRVQMLGAIAGARIIELESPFVLRDVLDSEENRDLAVALLNIYGAYLEPGNIKGTRSTSFAMYLKGRIAEMMVWDRRAIVAYFGPKAGAALYDPMSNYLLDARNHGFVKAAGPVLDAGNAVIAVGAFHLPGRHGLVRLFRDAGYSVERVSTPGEVPE